MYNKYQEENSEKRRIFKIAMKYMEQTGYEGLSVRNICQAAGISVGKFYRYFSNKQMLLRYFYDEAFEQFKGDIEGTLKDAGLKEQIVRFYKGYTDYAARLGFEFVLNFFSPTNETLDFDKYHNNISDTVESFIEKAVQDGYILKGGKTIRDLSREITVIVQGAIFEWCVCRGNFSLPDYTEQLLNDCIDGII